MHDKSFKIVFWLLIAVAFYSCAQQKKVVKKLTAYSMEILPGTVMKDEGGDAVPVKPAIVLLVYAETKTNTIKWDSAWFENKTYKLIPQLSPNGSFEVGFRKQSDEKIIENADSSRFLYQLYLQPVENGLPVPAGYEHGRILLKAHYNGRVFYRKSDAPLEIRTYDAM